MILKHRFGFLVSFYGTKTGNSLPDVRKAFTLTF